MQAWETKLVVCVCINTNKSGGVKTPYPNNGQHGVELCLRDVDADRVLWVVLRHGQVHRPPAVLRNFDMKILKPLALTPAQNTACTMSSFI